MSQRQELEYKGLLMGYEVEHFISRNRHGYPVRLRREQAIGPKWVQWNAYNAEDLRRLLSCADREFSRFRVTYKRIFH